MHKGRIARPVRGRDKVGRNPVKRMVPDEVVSGRPDDCCGEPRAYWWMTPTACLHGCHFPDQTARDFLEEGWLS